MPRGKRTVYTVTLSDAGSPKMLGRRKAIILGLQEKYGGGVWVPMRLIADRSLPALALRVYCILYYFAGGVEKEANLDRELVAKRAGRGLTQVGEALRALERGSYITNLSGPGERAVYRIERVD